MDGTSGDDIWRSVPPEEKFEAMAQAQAYGVVSASIVVLICSTIAVGLKLKWLMWGSLICSPFIFQFGAGKKWRDVKPRVMLEYLGARSAARRFAFSARGKNLSCKFMFRGKIEQIFPESAVQEALEAMIDNTNEAQVWVALFGDSLVLLQENIGGAEARFAQLIDDKLSVESRALDNKGDYSSNKEIILKASNRARTKVDTFRLTSPYPAALIVFEKKLAQIRELQIIASKVIEELPLKLNDEFDDEGSGLMIFE
jgi:hypothetical protein